MDKPIDSELSNVVQSIEDLNEAEKILIEELRRIQAQSHYHAMVTVRCDGRLAWQVYRSLPIARRIKR